MWLSKKLALPLPQETAADLGITTVSGKAAGVMTRGEARALPLYGPGGLLWRPRNGDTVLVIKGGPGGEEACVAGAEQRETDLAAQLEPGELLLYTEGGAVLYLQNNGRVDIRGALYINGKEYVPPGE